MLTISDIVGNVQVGGTCTAMARIVDWQNNLLVLEEVASISLTVYDYTNTPVPNFSGVAVTPSAVIYDTLQTPSFWTADAVGYNFAHTIDVSANPAFAVGGLYFVVYTIQPISGQAILVRYVITAN